MARKVAGSNRERRLEIIKETHKCGFCPIHDRENRGRRERADRYKSRRKGRGGA